MTTWRDEAAAHRMATASRRAGVSEVCWLARDGTPRATAGVPLEHDGRPALALLWSQADQAEEIAASAVVSLTVSDRRLGQREWEAVSATGSVSVVPDRDGTLFGAGLLDQELRKHPPSRAYADTTLLRRENWWFLPRLVLVLDVHEAHPVGERTAPGRHGVLAVATGTGRLAVDTVDVVGMVGADRTSVDAVGVGTPRSLAGRHLPPGDAVLLMHDFSVPDLERWGRHVTTGRWDGERLDVVTGPATSGVPRSPGLIERVRRHRALERDCRRALRRT